MGRRRWAWAGPLVLCGLALGGCDGAAVQSDEADQTEAWKGALEGSCEAEAVLAIANEASLSELDVDAKLEKRAAENIVAERPFATVKELDAVSRVGHSALDALLAHAEADGLLAGCDGEEIGVVSDLDQTVIPKSDPDLALGPYPGVSTLYTLLEMRNGGVAGDVTYVTAREPEGVVDVPAYLENHGVPAGPIETGTSGIPWVAQPEKVKDVKAVLARTGTQRFVLLGDTAHRDPEVYKTIVADHPERIAVALIHKVTATVAPSRVETLYLHENYAEAAAILAGLGVLTEDEALTVWEAASAEGLDVSEAAMKDLLAEHAR